MNASNVRGAWLVNRILADNENWSFCACLCDSVVEQWSGDSTVCQSARQDVAVLVPQDGSVCLAFTRSRSQTSLLLCC